MVSGCLAVRARFYDEPPHWYTFATLAFFTAISLAVVVGDMNFWYHMEPFYDLMFLAPYPDVNPSRDLGQQFMDAGRLYFASDAQLDLKKAEGFRSADMYCVAPVSIPNANVANYDFWAVGVNCCNGGEFKCGEYTNPRAHSGLRLMREDQRPFFRLAVQQAEAAYNIKAQHPVFFQWVEDPLVELNTYRNEGFRWFWVGNIAFFIFDLFCVLCASIGFSKIGRLY